MDAVPGHRVSLRSTCRRLAHAAPPVLDTVSVFFLRPFRFLSSVANERYDAPPSPLRTKKKPIEGARVSLFRELLDLLRGFPSSKGISRGSVPSPNLDVRNPTTSVPRTRITLANEGDVISSEFVLRKSDRFRSFLVSFSSVFLGIRDWKSEPALEVVTEG